MKVVLYALLGCFMVSAVHANELDRLLEECREGGSAGASAYCLMEKDRQLGRQLTALYQEILSHNRYSKEIIDSQRAWLKFQDNDCRTQGRLLEHEGEVFRNLAYAACTVKHTLNRIDDLLRYKQLM